MTKKKKENQQLSIWDINNMNNFSDNNDDDYDDWAVEEYDDDFKEKSDRIIEKSRELLTLKLLTEAIKKENENDQVMADFCEYVLPNLIKYGIGIPAKGGKFFDAIDKKNQARRDEGKKDIRRDNAGDQSLNTHILNGLLPANLIERRLQKLDTTAQRIIKEKERRQLVAGFILHDFEKFDYSLFELMPEKYQQQQQRYKTTLNQEDDIRKLPIKDHRIIIDIIVIALGIDKLINPQQPSEWIEYRDDLLYIAYNAQRRSDTNLNLSEYGLQPKTRNQRILSCLADLTCLADLLASIIKHPQDAENNSINGVLHNLSDGQLKLTYHRLCENRGVLTNVVNNALMEVYTSFNDEEKDIIYYQPLLYLPTGVVYLALRDSPSVSIDKLPNQVVEKIKQLCRDELIIKQTGFGRDGKGMKYAEYYDKFFDDVGLMKVALKATLRILHDKKPSVAKKRSDSLIAFQQKQALSADYDFNFEDNILIDRLAEFGDVVSRKIWGEKVKQIELLLKNYGKQIKDDKKKKEIEEDRKQLNKVDIIQEVTKQWNLSEYLPKIREIQNINQSLKDLKIKGNTGGVPLEWYYLASVYIKENPQLENVTDECENIITLVSNIITPILEKYQSSDEKKDDEYQLADGWDDLRLWVKRIVMLPHQTQSITDSQKTSFLDELNAYQLAKKSGRGKQMICSVSHSVYSVSEQMESAVLFTPQVYTNKQLLGGSNAKRNISSIAGIEMMLRQILMNQTQAVGKKFEDGKYRYLYFYPTYYCTPETNKYLQKAYANIAQTRFDTSIRNHFIRDNFEVDLSRENYQTVDTLILEENLNEKQKLPNDNPNYKKDKTFKLSYPDDSPLTFYFIALPPEKKSRDDKPTDTESWIMPAWLGFTIPMLLDVKVAVSESPIPPFTDGTKFEETVFLDTAPIAIQSLTKDDRFRLDYILEGWEKHDKFYNSPLNALTIAYTIHLDVNAKQGKGGYDANWGKLTELAKDIETTPLSVFSYLKKWVRKKQVESPSIKKIKLYTYHFYPCFDRHATLNFEKKDFPMKLESESPLNHPLKLTQLYRQFYRAKYTKGRQPKANAILKPIDEAANVILKVDKAISENEEALIFEVAARINKLMDRVHSSTAEGVWMIKQRHQEREKVLEFAKYFVKDFFQGAFRRDKARLAGRQLNIIRDTCEFLYRLEDDREYQEKKPKD